MENTKSLLDEVLEHYENNDQHTDETPSEVKESFYKLQEYLVGDGDIRHLYDYYDLVNQGK
jgi:hypothetical protein